MKPIIEIINTDKEPNIIGKRGGLRMGAGRPKKEPTKTIAFRVPAKDCEVLRVKIKALIVNYR